MKGDKFTKLLGSSIALVTFGVLVYLENRRPLRRRTESKPVRDVRNLAIAGITAIVLSVVETPVTSRLTKLVQKRKWGLLKFIRLPRWLEIPLAIVLLDYTLYVWHVLTHRLPFLWRFHIVHHIDLDLDASTALRFHFAEMIVSVPWRAAQIVVIGVSPLSFAAWQAFLFPSILFHHSNVRLREDVEKCLSYLIVTPRIHGIHHSIVEEETNSNWSSGLAIWDRLHGTLKTDVPQDKIIIGVPTYREPDKVILTKVLKMPFEKQKLARDLPKAGRLTGSNRE